MVLPAVQQGRWSEKASKAGLDELSPGVKGAIGEAVTEIKYAIQGYSSQGKAVVATGGKTRTGQVQEAHYDHAMKNVFTGKKATVESKFNSSPLTPNQRRAQGNVTTPGGLIVDRTTSDQIGNAANTVIRGASAGAPE